MGTVSPVVAKLAVDRLKKYKRTGTAIGEVYAWGMVGSILGTFLTGFFLIDILGTKGVILLIGTILACGATMLGSVGHAVWAGVPLGLCVLAFTPPAWVDAVGKVIPAVKGSSFEKIGQDWGIREELGDPNTSEDDYAWVDESNYYYIKVNNETENGDGGEIRKRTLVLDNLIHGYFILDHPERLDYDYEHIYALVAYRAAQAGGKVKFKAPVDIQEEPAKPLDLKKAEPDTATKADQPKPNQKDAATTEPKSEPAQPKGGLLSVQAAGDDSKDSPKKVGKAAPAPGPDAKDSPAKPLLDADTKAAPPDGRRARLVGSRGRALGHEDLVPGRRRLLLSAAHAVRIPGDRRRRRRDRPGRHPCQLHGHRSAARHPDPDLLRRCPPVRRAQPGQETVRPGLRRCLQRLLGSLASHHPRVQRKNQEDAHAQWCLYDQHYRCL